MMLTGSALNRPDPPTPTLTPMTLRFSVPLLLVLTSACGSLRRESVNPVEWGLAFSMDQGEVVQGLERVLHMSGQVDLVEAPETELGLEVGHPGDIRAQIAASLANIDAVLEQAGMERANILSLRFFTTDMKGFLANYDVYAEWIAPAGTRPPQSLLGVAELVLPGLLVEIEVLAGE